MKEIHDEFADDLEDDNLENAERQTVLEETMADSLSEHETLQAALDQQTGHDADEKEQLTQTTSEQDDPLDQSASDENVSASTEGAWMVEVRRRANRVKTST